MGHKVLLADDSITVQKIVKLSLTEEGIEVIAFGNGEQAVQQLEVVQPDLVMADVFMPGKDGYEVCEFVKSHPQFKHIPVILLVHAFEPFDPEQAKKVHADEQLTKPFQSIRTLVTTVQELLARSQSSVVAGADTTKMPSAIFVAEPQLSSIVSLNGSQLEEEFAVVSSLATAATATTEPAPALTRMPDLTLVPAPVNFDSFTPVSLSETSLPVPEADAKSHSETTKTDFMPPLELSVLSSTAWQPDAATLTAATEPEFTASALSAISLSPLPGALCDASEDVLDLSDVLSSDLASAPNSPDLTAVFSPTSETPLLAILLTDAAASPLIPEMSAQAPRPISDDDSSAKTFDVGVGQINLDAPLPNAESASPSQAIETRAEFVPSAASVNATMSISEAMIEEIVNRVIQRLSAQAIQEIAWEVVPEMAELLIRKQLAKQQQLSH